MLVFKALSLIKVFPEAQCNYSGRVNANKFEAPVLFMSATESVFRNSKYVACLRYNLYGLVEAPWHFNILYNLIISLGTYQFLHGL